MGQEGRERMYESFRIQNYRGFRDLKLEGLARVNLIAGENNSGKTALLEALYIHALQGDSAAFEIVARPGRTSTDPKARLDPFWLAMFRDLDASNIVWLTATGPGLPWPRSEECANANQPSPAGTSVSLWPMEDEDDDALMRKSWTQRPLNPQPGMLLAVSAIGDVFAGHRASGRSAPTSAGRESRHGWPACFVSASGLGPHALVDDFTDLARARAESTVVDALKTFEPRLLGMDVLPGGSGAALYADLGLSKLLPMEDVGEGMNRWLTLALVLGQARGGIVLIDEVETGLHHSKHGDLWRLIADASRRMDVQVFATTHSLECIEAAHDVFAEVGPDDLRVHRLQEIQGDIHAITYPPDTLKAAIEAGMEVR